MSTPDKFTSREVQRSFRKFNDLASDVMSSVHQIWPDAINRLVDHCECDPVMRVVTSPLKADPRVDARKWWDAAIGSCSGMAGSGSYMLPPDDDERTSLLYQVLLLIAYNESINLSDFCITVYGRSRYQDMVDTFNSEVVFKFTREVSHRLNEVAEDTADQSEISRESIVVFNHHDYSTRITGNVYGSNVATGNAQLSHPDATLDSLGDIAAELRDLISIATEFSKTNQAVIKSSLEFLATQADTGNGDLGEVVEKTRTVIELSPEIRSRMERLLSNVSSSIAGSAIIEGIKLALGS